MAIITTTGCLIVTALSVAREREEGTFDQLLVLPHRRLDHGGQGGARASAVAVGQAMHSRAGRPFCLSPPFAGSLSLLMAGMVCYGLALAGIGLFISSFCFDPAAGLLGVFHRPGGDPPGLHLAGGEHAQVFQWLAAIDPHPLHRAAQGVFLKGFDWSAAWPPALAAVSPSPASPLSLALAMFRRHIA